jgi:hypothetical protein
MKALLMMQYNRSSTKFLGRRCNLRNDEIERDENGRIKQTECRDTNPGSLHLIVTNLIGRDKRSFAEDRTMNYQVWNQPVVSYQIDLLEEITVEQALDLLDPQRQVCTNSTYCYNEDAEKLYEVLIDVQYITESSTSTEPMLPNVGRYTRTDTYHYVLETEADGEIFGGEWISAQVTAFPDRVIVAAAARGLLHQSARQPGEGAHAGQDEPGSHPAAGRRRQGIQERGRGQHPRQRQHRRFLVHRSNRHHDHRHPEGDRGHQPHLHRRPDSLAAP